MRVNYSFSVTDEKLNLALRSFKEKGGNISRLVVTLLKNYFFGKTENPTAELLKIAEIEEELSKMAETFQKLQKEVDELKKKLQSEKEAKEIEERLDLIRLIETEFEDLKNPERIEQLKTFAKSQGTTLETFIEQRLSAIAAKCKASLPEAWELFFRVFPDLKNRGDEQ